MYICNCNGLNERDVDIAVCAGARRNGEVHAFHGCRPECGKCLPEIRARILESRTSVEIANRPTVMVQLSDASMAGAD